MARRLAKMNLLMMRLYLAAPAGAEMLLVYHLVSTGLAKRYPALTIWMVTLATSGLLLLPYENASAPGYRNAWLARQTIMLAALFFALLELTNRILEHYPGLRRMTATGLFGVLAATSVVATANQSFDKPVMLFWAVQGGWTIATLGYVLTLVALATYLDPRRRRNVILHERIFAANCACVAISSLLISTHFVGVPVANTINVVGGVLFPLTWMRMSSAGEVDRRPPVSPLGGAMSLQETQERLERLEKMVTRSNG